MFDFTSKHQTKVDGKMSSKDAGTVGKLQAAAVLIAAVLFGLAAVIAACAQFN